MEVHDIKQLLSEFFQGHVEAARKKEIDVQLHLPEQSIMAPIDVVYLGRIVDNLLSNAIKYTLRGKKVFMSLTGSDHDFSIKIRDQGQGFTEADQEKMFRKFQKLSAQPTAGESSTGLGLSIVKNLVDKMNGKISFESRKDIGSEFTVIFQRDRKGEEQVA